MTAAPEPDDLRDVLNTRLHELLGVERPCATACIHVLSSDWTALGAANALARSVFRSGLVVHRADPEAADVCSAIADASERGVGDLVGFAKDAVTAHIAVLRRAAALLARPQGGGERTTDE